MELQGREDRARKRCDGSEKTDPLHRVLIVHANIGDGLELAVKWTARGAQAVVVTTVEHALRAGGPFDRGIFSLELSDGSGITLAAALIDCERINEVEFLAERKTRRPQDEVREAPPLSHERAVLRS